MVSLNRPGDYSKVDESLLGLRGVRMSCRRGAPFFVLLLLLFAASSLVYGRDPNQLEIVLIGQGQGPFLIPAGETTQLRFEILNGAPMDVYLVQGDVFLDPNLNGRWVNIHSESLGGFHLNYLQSAIWRLNLEMPAAIHATNSTNGYPLVVLLVQITYSTGIGLQEMQQEQYGVSVPGATVGQPYALAWVLVVAVVIVLVACVLAYGAYRKTMKRNRTATK